MLVAYNYHANIKNFIELTQDDRAIDYTNIIDNNNYLDSANLIAHVVCLLIFPTLLHI